MSHDESPLEVVARSTPSRRTLLRTGAHAAWMIPAVQIVSQVPAFAASGDGLSLTQATWSGGSVATTLGPVQFDPHVTIQNNDVHPAAGLMGTITIHSSTGALIGGYLRPNSITSNSPAGWTLGGITGRGTHNVTLVYTAIGSLAAGASINLAPTITIQTPPRNQVLSLAVVVTSSTYGAIGSPLTHI